MFFLLPGLSVDLDSGGQASRKKKVILGSVRIIERRAPIGRLHTNN
jgi:hypothetical protein